MFAACEIILKVTQKKYPVLIGSAILTACNKRTDGRIVAPMTLCTITDHDFDGRMHSN